MLGTYCRLGVPKIQKKEIITPPLLSIRKNIFPIKIIFQFNHQPKNLHLIMNKIFQNQQYVKIFIIGEFGEKWFV